MLVPQTLEVADQIFQAVFGCKNPYSLEKLKEKFANNISLPVIVHDSKTQEETWSVLPDSEEFMTLANTDKFFDTTGWMRPKRPLKNLKELLAAWREINPMVTERVYNSENVHTSDTVYESTDMYNCANCGEDKKLIFCEGTYRSESCLGCQRSGSINYCICVDDSNTTTNSYNVMCSNKITNSLFIQDCGSLHECMFCSHILHQEFCIANMQYEKDEYYYLKQQVINWILSDAKVG